MRVLNSILLLTSAFADKTSQPIPINKEYKGKHSWNRLASLNFLMNRLAATGKGLNPNNADELNDSSYKNAERINNRYFNKCLAKWYLKTEGEGEDKKLVCANHERLGKEDSQTVATASRKRRDEPEGSLNSQERDDMDYHMANLCEMLEDEDDDIKCDNNKRGSGGKDLSKNYGKSTKQIFGGLKKWNELYLSGCKKNRDTRFRRIVRLMSRRLYDGVRSDLITKEDVKKGKWKRVFPKSIDIYLTQEDKANKQPMNKNTLIDMVLKRFDRN